MSAHARKTCMRTNFQLPVKRQVGPHLSGVECPELREEMVEAVLSGVRNRDLGESREQRLAMIPGLMRIVKDRLKLEKLKNSDRRLVWNCYNGVSSRHTLLGGHQVG